MRASTAADAVLSLRDQALAALDAGSPARALDLSGQALIALEAHGLHGGLDEAAVLIARAEIEEARGQFAAARVTITAATAILASSVTDDADDDSVSLWCQAQERTAVLERLAAAAIALGVVHKHTANLDAAEAAYRRASTAVAGMTNPDPLLEAGLLHNLGVLAHARGDAATGIPLAERGIALRTGALGASHPDVARDLNALGALYHLAGRPDDAAAACGRALTVFEDRYGPVHFEVAMACGNLAVLRGDQGDYRQAESLGRRSLHLSTTILGPDDPEVGLTLLNLAAAAAGQHRLAEARERASRAAEILAGKLPAGHPHVLAAAGAVQRYGRPA